MLSNTSLKLSNLISNIPSYFSTPEIRIECKNDSEKRSISKQAVNFFKNSYECITIDGARIKFPNGWALVRSSNTQPVIVCRFEADSENSLNDIKKVVFDKLKEFGNINVD